MYKRRYSAANIAVMVATMVEAMSSDATAQCAMCWSSLANSEGGGGLIQGVQQAVLFLLPVPFLLAGVIGVLLCRAARRGKRVDAETMAD